VIPQLREAAGAKQAAEKLVMRRREVAGAKAHLIFAGFIGPAKAVPLLQSLVGLCGREFFRSL
jgi:hypothetical protein